MSASILIVDDDQLNQIILKQTLQSLYQLELKSSGEEALKWLQNNCVDLILLDIQMPGLDGYEVLKRLKSNPNTHNIPVIFISANTSLQDEMKGLELGALDYITKPFSPPIVSARVKNQVMLKQKTDLLEKLAAIDGLTELPNRRYFDENITKEFRRCQRNRQDLSLIMFDVDYFKYFNDNYGHQKGDECLKMIANKVSELSRRGGDFCARFGGEEFVLVLPGVTPEQAIKIAQKLRCQIEALEIPHAFSEISQFVTVSVGVASCTQLLSPSVEGLIELADSHLYLAKEHGRNQCSSLHSPASQLG